MDKYFRPSLAIADKWRIIRTDFAIGKLPKAFAQLSLANVDKYFSRFPTVYQGVHIAKTISKNEAQKVLSIDLVKVNNEDMTK